ncbi:MAG: mannonate dehydratase, partial [Termitinemataceae bacterium]
DGTTVLSYNEDIIEECGPERLFEWLQNQAQGFILPGWEPDRLTQVKNLVEYYQSLDEESLFANLRYFLTAVLPICEKYDIKLALHPDDPPWQLFGVPRIVTNLTNLRRIVSMVPSPSNGLTICTGSLGVHPDNDILKIIRELKDRVYFVHIRNVKRINDREFDETSHISSDGDLDMYGILKTLHDCQFSGCIRPDHGRAIWGEVAMPGYGLFDQALGAAYMYGLLEAIEKDTQLHR